MFATTKVVEFASAPLAVAAAFLSLINTNTAHAQIVGNGSFEVPNVSGDQGGLVQHVNPALTGPGVLWNFPTSPGGDSGITVGGSTGAFNAPNAPEGNQMAWIRNHGVIWQSVTLSTGNYELSFKLAQRSYGCSAGSCGDNAAPLHIMVSAGAQTFGPFEATSAASFDPVTIPFKVVGTEAQMLIFYGESLVFVANQEDHVAYIDAVSIKPVVPKILSGPSDIDPDSAILLSGENFGLPTGQIKVAFRNASVEPFSNGDGSKTEFHLKTVGSDTFAESDTPIDVAHPQGAVDGQTVDITIATAAGFQSSNVWHARFHNKAVITSGPGTITPGQSFILRGWDFDSKAECSSEKRGTVTVRFSDKSYKSFPNQGPSNASDTDLVIPILGSGCLSDSIKIRLPADTAGVVAQAVQIIYESPGGRKSNPWPAQFAPKLETIAFPWQLVGVNCSDQSAHDACNIPDDSTDSECGWFDGLGSDWPDTSIVAVHVGCWGLDSDNGTDAYVAMVSSSRGWSMSTGVSVSPAVANASYSTNAVPIAFATTSGLVFNVNWHIGAEGGAIWYGGPIYITGPVGVPYQ